MSKRTLRRAAERQSRKAERNLNPTPERSIATAAAPALAIEPQPDMEFGPYLIPEHQEADSDNLPRTRDVAQPRHASAAQIAANRENANLSTGPVTPEGRAKVSQNRRTHGLTGRLIFLSWEDAGAFQEIAQSMREEYNPETGAEERLVEALTQHYWLKERAITLQEGILAQAINASEADSKKLSLFLRYQTTHERSYYKAERELKNIQKEKRKQQLGFESQNQKQEAHEARVRLTHARAQNLEIDTACRQVMEAPIPGNEKISFAELTHACSTAVATLVYQNQFATAARS